MKLETKNGVVGVYRKGHSVYLRTNPGVSQHLRLSPDEVRKVAKALLTMADEAEAPTALEKIIAEFDRPAAGTFDEEKVRKLLEAERKKRPKRKLEDIVAVDPLALR